MIHKFIEAQIEGQIAGQIDGQMEGQIESHIVNHIENHIENHKVNHKVNHIDAQMELPVQVKPVAADYYLRPKAAEKMMRKAAGINQTVWIGGISGIGKTSFVADFLGRKRYDYYSAREVIPAQIQVPAQSEKTKIVVIDDLYGIIDSVLYQEWERYIESMTQRDDIWLILVSRADIPRWLHSLSVRNIFYRIEEDSLFLTRAQTEEYFRLRQLTPSIETVDRIWNLGYGHPQWNSICAMELSQTKDENQAVENARVSLWKYTNVYVYDEWDSEVLDTIMKLSILETFDLEMAVYMTRNKNVNLVLLQAMEFGSFLREDNGVWTILRPVCFAMIQRIQQSYDTEYIASLYIRAGDCFKIKGSLMRALAMYEQAGSNQSIAELLIQNARENPSSGHYLEMKHYYMTLPENVIIQSVELMGAMCMLQSLLMNDEESERWYQKLEDFAGKQTGSLKTEASNKLLYLDIALPHRGSGGMVSILKMTGSLLFHHKAKLPEFSVTSNLPSLMNGGKDFCEWSKKDKELANSIGKVVCAILGKYGKGLVNLALAESGFEKGVEYYEAESLAVKGRMEAEAGGKIEQCFVGAGIMAWLEVFTNHPDYARDTIDGFCEAAQRAHASSMLLKNGKAMNCRIALYQGRTAEIIQWMKEAPNENQEFFIMERLRYLTKVRVYLSDHRYEEAKILLSKLDFYAQKMKRTYIAMETRLLQSILYYRMGENRWQSLLQETITEAESYHFVRILSREGAALLPLLRKSSLMWQDLQFEKQVKTETAYMAQIYPGYLCTQTSQAVLELNEHAIKILRMQALGKTVEEISRELDISSATVKYHNKETYRKLGVKTKAQAINEARNRNLL